MSQFNDTGCRAFTAETAIGKNLRVTTGTAANSVALAGTADKDLGTTSRAANTAGDPVDVRLRTKEGTHKMVANGAIAYGAEVFTAALGKVGASSTGAFALGTALEAASADGDVIEVLYNAHGDTAAT